MLLKKERCRHGASVTSGESDEGQGSWTPVGARSVNDIAAPGYVSRIYLFIYLLTDYIFTYRDDDDSIYMYVVRIYHIYL